MNLRMVLAEYKEHRSTGTNCIQERAFLDYTAQNFHSICFDYTTRYEPPFYPIERLIRKILPNSLDGLSLQRHSL